MAAPTDQARGNGGGAGAELSRRIKMRGLDLGFGQVGIAPCRDYPEHAAEARARGTYDLFEANPHSFIAGCFPSRYFPQGTSAVCATLGFGHQAVPDQLRGHIGRVYLSRSYTPRPDSIAGRRVTAMADFLRELGMQVYDGPVEPPARPLAQDAGIVRWGANNFCFTEDDGSFCVIYVWLVDAALAYDTPAEPFSCPPGCQRCVDACPTGALSAPRTLDPTRCALYANIGRTDDPAVTDALGGIVHGCDLCQEACPRNHAVLREAQEGPRDPLLDALAPAFDLERMLLMTGADDPYYRDVIHPVMYNYVRDVDILRRNAAIALGNAGDAACEPALREALRRFPGSRTADAARDALRKLGRA
ncbi:MAG: epoxyqueuosine reductase [Eggerthellaceae bacterium]|nr:epoxyqueuosine reductase [Eggerthellaceae bacterium]